MGLKRKKEAEKEAEKEAAEAEPAKGTAALSEEQAAVYDRQLRVWGVETQQRIGLARVLVAGAGSGLAAWPRS